MIPDSRLRQGGCRATTRRRIAVVYATVASLGAASLCAASDVSAGSISSNDPRVAPNASVAINEAAPEETAIQETTSESREAGDRQAKAGERKQTSLLSAKRRGAKQAGLSRESARLSGSQDAPWYRTGIGALAIVLVLVGVAAWAIRRWMPAVRGGESGIVRVVARTSLSPKHNLALVRVGHRFVLVGVSGDRVNTLCEVSDPGEVAELAARTGTSGDLAAGDFDDRLLREVADYRTVAEPETGQVRSTRERRVRAREPLNDLLRKLRALQSK